MKKIKLFFYLFLFPGISLLGVVPPEIPANIGAWGYVNIEASEIAPVFENIGYIVEPHGYRWDDNALIPSNNLREFMNVIDCFYGILVTAIHGSPDGWMIVEYLGMDEGSAKARLNFLKEKFKIAGTPPGVDEIRYYQPDAASRYEIRISPLFIQKRTRMPNSLVFLNGCYSYKFIEAFTGAGCCFGWNDHCYFDDAYPGTNNIFGRMGGCYFVAQDEFRNKTADEAKSEYPNPKLVMAGNKDMKLYNSPRIAGVLITQEGKPIYQYGAYGDSPRGYPYQWDYAEGRESGMKSAASVGDKVINVKILFSSFMDEDMLDEVRVKSETGGENYIVSGDWTGGTIFDRDVWEGTFTIDSWEDYESKAVLVVDAKDDFEGDVNERLDTDGDGNSNGIDSTHKFKITDLSTIKNQCIEKDGSSLQNLALSNLADPSASMEGTFCFLDLNAEDVPIDISKIYFTFSKPMDETTTTPAISAPSASFDYDISWKGEDTVELNLTENLDYCKYYTIKISGEATDTSGVYLDGNEDGQPGGDYFFTFTTEEPPVELAFEPPSSRAHLFLLPGDDFLEGNVLIDGSELKKGVQCNVSNSTSGSGGISFSGGEGSASVSEGGSEDFPFSVSASGQGYRTVSFDLTSSDANCLNKTGYAYYGAVDSSSEGGGGGWRGGHPGFDHPDDNQSPGEVAYTTGWEFEPDSVFYEAKVGIFPYGWGRGYGHFLGRYGIKTTPVFSDLKYWKDPERDLSEVIDLLVIGTGALFGFESATFEQNLEDYVAKGGNLLVFTQVRNEDFSFLPGNFSAAGWTRDMSCYYMAAYLNQWHPIFSGLTRHWIRCHIDGYITRVPRPHKVLLRRTKNGTASLVTYQYGQGTVIVTSAYPDWAVGRSQFSLEERVLLRDLTTWAMNPEMYIPEFYPDSNVSVPVIFHYTASDTVNAATAIVKIYNPDRRLYDSLSVPVSLTPGDLTEWQWDEVSLPERLGLWVIDYALLDGAGECIQKYKRGAIFSQRVYIPVGDKYNLRDFEISVETASYNAIAGDTVNYELSITNNSDSSFTGKIIVANFEGGIWNKEWKGVVDSIPNVTIPSDTTVNMTFKRVLYTSTSTVFGLYENEQNYYPRSLLNALTTRSTGIQIETRLFALSLSSDKYRYILSKDTIYYRESIRNRLDFSYSLRVELYALLDSVRYDIRNDTIELAVGDTVKIEDNFFPIDYDTTAGRGKLHCDVFYGDNLWLSQDKYFYLTYPKVYCSLAIPDSFHYEGSNPYTVTLNSEGVQIPPGKLLIEGNNFSDSIIFGNIPSPETTFVFNYSPDVWEIPGKIKVQYECEGQKVSTGKELPFSSPLISGFRPQYREPRGGFVPRDTAEFKAQVSLKGGLYGVPAELCLWSDYLGADTLRDTIILNPCSRRTINFKAYTDISVPADTAIPYSYRMRYLNKESTNSRKLTYFITPAEAVLNWPVNDTFSIGSTIPIRFRNKIPTFSKVDIQSISIYGNDIEESFLAPGEVSVPAEGYYTFPITVPYLKKGQYRLEIVSEMVEGKGVNLNSFPEGCPIYIDGIEADMEVSTSKNYYGFGEDIPFASLLQNGGYGWSGEESLKVARVSDSLGRFSIRDITEYGGLFGLIPDGGGGLVLDYDYSLGSIARFPIAFSYYYYYFSLTKDEWDNLWVYYSDYEVDGHILKHGGPDDNFDIVDVFDVPDSVGSVCDLSSFQGILYLAASDSGRIYKFNSASGSIVGYLEPPDRKFLNLVGVAVKENGNILVLEDTDPGVLWELSNSGDSIAAIVLADSGSYYSYNDIEYNNGTVFIATSGSVLRIKEAKIDTLIEGWYFNNMVVSDEGKVVTYWGGEGGCGMYLFSPEGIEEAMGWIDCSTRGLLFYKNDILAYTSDGWIYVHREFGKNYGMIGVLELPGVTSRYKLYSSKTFDDPKTGSISYGFLNPNSLYPDEDNFLPLESMNGTDSLLPIYITMRGNCQNSPVFYDCSLNIKFLDAIDSLIVENEYPLNLSPFENVSFADTIKDTIPPADYCVLGDAYWDAYSDYPQHMSSDWKSFKVIGNNLTLFLNSDKEEGFAGDSFRINPITINPLPLAEDDLHLLIRGYFNEKETTYVDTSFDLLAESADSFPFSIIPEEPGFVKAELISSSSDTILREFYPLIKTGKLLSISLNSPHIVDFQPFGVISEVYNHSFDDFSVEVRRMFLSDTLIDTVNIEHGGFYTFIDSFSTESSDTLKVVATAGGEVFTKKRLIDLGIKGNIKLDSLYEVSPDFVEMSGIVRNEGVYPLECKALFCLVEGATELSGDGSQFSANILTPDLPAKQLALSSVSRVGKDITFTQFVRQLADAGVDTSFSVVSLTPGRADTVPIVFNHHNAGSYELQAFLFDDSLSFMFDSATSTVNVIRNNQVFVDSLIVSSTCDSSGNVILTAIVENQSYANFTGDISVSSINCYVDSSIEVHSSSKDTLVLLIGEIFYEGVHTFTSIISEGGVAVSQDTQNLELHPIYRFDSLPVGFEVSAPDSGTIRIPVRNIGNARGERKVDVNLGDIMGIYEEAAIVEPAVSDTFMDNFLIPEDFPGGEYFANAYILNDIYPEVDTFFKVKVEGLIIRARDTLDKLVYNLGDTAEFSILVENQSLWSGELLVSLLYGELELDTSFVLGGMEKGILNDTITPLRDTVFLDTSGVYMFDPFNTEGYDSVSLNWDISIDDSIDIEIRTDSLIGKGRWITIEEDTVYPVSDWMQLKFENVSQNNQWLNSLVLNFKPSGYIELDTFPVQKETITLDVPVDSSQGKLGWGIHYPSGRAIVLDERYVYLADSLLSIFTDKGRYEIFDTVYATLIKNFPDTNYNFEYRVYFSPIEEIRDTFVLAKDTTNFSFVIPEWTRSGTYSIDYIVDTSGTQIILNGDAEYTEKKDMLSERNPNPEIRNPNLTTQPLNDLTAGSEEVLPLAKQWVMGKPSLNVFGDSAFISGDHLFDVDGITVILKNAKMDTNIYHNGQTAKISIDISSDTDLSGTFNISSTGSSVVDTNIDLVKDIPNKFEFNYPIEGCQRGMNELYLHLAKDEPISLIGFVIYFDVYVSDTTPPVISIVEEPSNTYSSNRSYQVRARIYDPDTSGTPFTDTLYYRIASSGGGYWHSLSAHSVIGDTNKYLIPSHPNGTHIEYNLIARDEFGNVGRYPEEGSSDFWILSSLKATWSELTYLVDTTTVLTWNPPEELIYYHCGLSSDTIDIKEEMVATRFTTQCLPARLEKIGVEIFNENLIPLSDTLIVSVHTIADDSLPGVKIDSFEFIGALQGYTELNLPGIEIPEEGIFISIKGSDSLNVFLDGYGKGTHTAINSGISWSLATSGELLIDGFASHLPSTSLRGPSDIFTFDVFKSVEPSNWMKIASGLTSTTYTDESVVENQGYSYRIMTSFGNPVDSFFSVSRDVFVDLSPPEMDTIAIDTLGGDELIVWAVLTDTSGIAWDSLGYKDEDTINMISEDSSKNDTYFFSFTFLGDTLSYFLKVQDSSLIGNYARYPECGFYKWGSQAGIFDESIPDSTYLIRILNVLVGRNIEIKYALSKESNVQIMFFDILGRKAKTLVDETQKAGYYTVPMQSTELPQGVYFLQMEAGDYQKTVKLVKLR